MSAVAEKYLALLADDPVARRALLTCAAALRLEDEGAVKAVDAVLETNGLSAELVHRIKKLGCVWERWDGSWYLAEDVRPYLHRLFLSEIPEAKQAALRDQLELQAKRKAAHLKPDGQITQYMTRQAEFEAAFHRTLAPGKAEEGAEHFVRVWLDAPSLAATATARAVDYLAPEFELRLSSKPPELLFLQGMAAKARRDRKQQETYFGAVWEAGRPGFIFAVAAHMYALVVRDQNIAERALGNSLEWHDEPAHQGQVYHSLGNLLAENRNRWGEAENAYKKSLSLDSDPAHQGQVYHSLGNLLAENRNRWGEAENAYKKSFSLDSDPAHQGQVYHSLGNLLAENRNRWGEAENAHKKSLSLLSDPAHQGQVYHSLGNLLAENRNRWGEAENAYKKSLSLDSDLAHQGQVYHSLGNLLARNRNRWGEAENAYKKSLDLLRDPSDRVRVLCSWSDSAAKLDTEAGNSRGP